ncbi:MAG: hypothetical protein ACKVQA_01680 [Burkholderiales bacterium]
MEVDKTIEPFLPADFAADPMKYFEEQGAIIRTGEITYKKHGWFKCDPASVRDFPVWRNSAGGELHVVGKRVNPLKSDVWRARNPFYEFLVMELVLALGFKTSRPYARIAQRGVYYIIAEKVEGFRWVRSQDSGIEEADLVRLRAEAETVMLQLAASMDGAGVRIPWHSKDMILIFEPNTLTVKEVVPIDWERLELDFEKLSQIPQVEHLLNGLKPKVSREKRWISEEWKQKRQARG